MNPKSISKLEKVYAELQTAIKTNNRAKIKKKMKEYGKLLEMGG